MPVIDDPDRAMLTVLREVAARAEVLTGRRSVILIGPRNSHSGLLPQKKIGEYAGIEIWAPAGVALDFKV